MAQILVRNLTEDIVARLKLLAANENKSMEQYLREVVIRAAGMTQAEAVEQLRQIRERTEPIDFDSTAAIREDRDSR